jgi:riboflavin kinase/FMN adenylyltransferase
MKRYDFMHLSAHPVLWQVPMVVSIGVFDGIHRGHLAILDRTISFAKENGWESMVITFDKNPKMVTKSQPYHSKLTTEAQMQEILANLGVNHMVVIDFSADFSKLTAEEFLALVCAFCQVKAMVVGEDFRCGAPASSAGPVQLQEHLNRLSPGAIEGALEEIQGMLGRPYELDLVAYPSKFTEDGLLYRTASFMQLLPMAGVYDAYLTLSDDTKVPVKTIIGNEDLLIIPKVGMWDRKLLRTKRLGLIAKGSSS